jgi:hypothetical protein
MSRCRVSDDGLSLYKTLAATWIHRTYNPDRADHVIDPSIDYEQNVIEPEQRQRDEVNELRRDAQSE